MGWSRKTLQKLGIYRPSRAFMRSPALLCQRREARTLQAQLLRPYQGRRVPSPQLLGSEIACKRLKWLEKNFKDGQSFLSFPAWPYTVPRPPPPNLQPPKYQQHGSGKVCTGIFPYGGKNGVLLLGRTRGSCPRLGKRSVRAIESLWQRLPAGLCRGGGERAARPGQLLEKMPRPCGDAGELRSLDQESFLPLVSQPSPSEFLTQRRRSVSPVSWAPRRARREQHPGPSWPEAVAPLYGPQPAQGGKGAASGLFPGLRSGPSVRPALFPSGAVGWLRKEGKVSPCTSPKPRRVQLRLGRQEGLAFPHSVPARVSPLLAFVWRGLSCLQPPPDFPARASNPTLEETQSFTLVDQAVVQ
uniref:uncharacterized protein LOC128928358 n=1 Tax=Callithrix jacchus TaxID=9483 RepID=UPI0023DD169F|nr:uncharacterized protein LOC128928358 [Callithrix jacchus]